MLISFLSGDVVARNVICTCLPGYKGNPFLECTPEEAPPPTPCHPNPCGANAECRAHGSAGSCFCLPGFPKGDPHDACRPECVTNSDCHEYGRKKACIQQKCQVKNKHVRGHGSVIPIKKNI